MESAKSFIPKFEDAKESITTAAILYAGEIFTGLMHADALQAILRKYPELQLNTSTGLIDGFMTSKGRFVDRQEAGAIAKAAQQLEQLHPRQMQSAEKHLKSEDFLDPEEIDDRDRQIADDYEE